MGVAGDRMNYLFYEEDPGVTVPDVRDVTYEPDTEGIMPEFTGLTGCTTTSFPAR